MSRTGFFIILLVLYILIEVYIYKAFLQIFENQRWVTVVYWLVTVLTILSMYGMSQFSKPGEMRSPWVNVAFGMAIGIIFYKILFALFLLVQDLSRITYGGARKIVDATQDIPSRRKFLTSSAAFLLGLPLASTLYGLTRGKYDYTVEKTKLPLPFHTKNIDGFKVAQISDIHAGTFDSLEGVEKGIDMIMAQKPDIIVFTGDLVNSHLEEIEPYIHLFKKLYAPHGLYACTGNHDYYARRNHQRKHGGDDAQFMARFRQICGDMGFELLNNTSKTIYYNNTPINIIGIENWGKGPFPKLGDLEKATASIDPAGYNILLSHDPSFWEEKVKSFKIPIHLTLSGHTHGMQFGINYKNFKWSPAQYRYPCWMGHYEEDGRSLYVNRGYGCLAFPGRIGMSPEISLLELSETDA